MNKTGNVIYILLMVVVLASWACTEARIAEWREDNILEPAVPAEGHEAREDSLLLEEYHWYRDHREADVFPPGNFRYRTSGPEPLLFYPDHHHFSMDSIVLD